MNERIDGVLDKARKALDEENFSSSNSLCELVLSDSSMDAMPVQRVVAMLLLAEQNIAQGRVADAMSRTAEAISIARLEADEFLLGLCGFSMARISYELAEFTEALGELERIRPLIESAEDGRLSFRFHTFLGTCHLAAQKIQEAIRNGEKAILIAENLSDPRCQIQASGKLASYWLAEGTRLSDESRTAQAHIAFTRAFELNEAALEMAKSVAPAEVDLALLSKRAMMLAALGRHDEAFVSFAEHRQICVQRQTCTTLPSAVLAEAQLSRRLGNAPMALELLREGISISQSEVASDPEVLRLASELEAERGNFEQALVDFRNLHSVVVASNACRAELRASSMAVKLEAKRAVGITLLDKERAYVLRRENQKLEHKARELSKDALEDSLTGLANRRRIDAYLESWHAESLSSASPAWLAIIDLDFFKLVNDRFSHGCGDRVLQLLGILLESGCRPGDLAGRLGGEEFVLCLDVKDHRQALGACERIRRAVAEYNWDAVAKGLTVTISVGLADLSRHLSVSEGLDAADRELYRAKASGRNKVCQAL